MQTKWYPAHTNNFERTREKIELIVLHWSAGESLSQTDTKFTNPNRLASVHFAIENVDIHNYVKEDQTAYHSGSAGVDRRSLGIICIGGPNLPISDATYQTTTLLIEELCRKLRIPIDRDHIKGHREISEGQCPGSLDLERIVKDAKALSPQSIMDKLQQEKEQLRNQFIDEKKKNDTSEARFEELRGLIANKDEDIIALNVRVHELKANLEKTTLMNHRYDAHVMRLRNELVKLSALANRSVVSILVSKIKAPFLRRKFL